jgi:hypothetical protein
MAIVVPNVGEVIALNLFFNKATPENQVLRLFATNITPAETDTAGTYTEAAGGGYANKALTGTSWTVTGGAPSTAAAGVQTFTFTGPLTTNATVFGYYVTQTTSGILMFAESFASFTPTNNGDNIALTLNFTAD